MTDKLSGLEVEYAIALDLQPRSRQARGDDRLRRRAGQPGPRLPRRSAGAVRRAAGRAGEAERSRDDDGQPTIGKLLVPATRQGHVYPPQAKRLAPDLFFQPQVYRARRRDGAAAAGQVHRGVQPRAGISACSDAKIDDSGSGGARTRGQAASAGSTRRRSASTAATTTSTPPAAPTTPARPKASRRRTCSARSRAKG